MKKILFISVALAATSVPPLAGQERLIVKPTSISNKAFPVVKHLPINDAIFPAPVLKKNPSVMMAVGRLVGYSCYDLQTNNSLGKRIINHGDGTLSFVWTIDDECSSNYANRGSGYNYWNGGSLLYPTGATARLEAVRTGFGHIGLLGNGSEVIFAHKGPPYDFIMSTNVIKGSGSWTGVNAGATLVLPGGTANGLWGRFATGGSDGNSIHLLASYNVSSGVDGVQMGVEGPFTYSRSTDAGQSWDIQSVNLPGYDSTRAVEGSAEDYAIDARDTTVAVVHGGLDEDVALWKSTDNGTNWTETFILPNPFAPSIDSLGGPTDTIVCNDGALDVVIDSNDVVHVAYSLERVLDNGTLGDGSFYIFPGDMGLVYWNDTAQTNVSIPINILDIDNPTNMGNGTNAYEVGAATVLLNNPLSASPPNARYGNKALLSVPSIAVDGNNIFIIFSLPTDGDSTADGRSFRDIWVVASSDGGQTFGTIQNITCTQQEEDYYAGLAKGVDNYLHILYQSDVEPGTSLQNLHPISANELYYAVVNKASVLAGTANCGIAIGVPQQNTSVFKIKGAYPNPTSDVTYFDVIMKQSASVVLEIYNQMGQKVYASANNFETGRHTLFVDARDFASGLYFYNIRSKDVVVSGKLTVVK